MLRLLLAAAATARLAAAASAPLPASNLLTEYVRDPIVIDVAAPRFFWIPNHPDRGVNQSAYHVLVTSLTDGNTTVWDSGVVQSNATTQIAYAGTALKSDTVYSWTVSWVDGNGATAPWADWAYFGTGLLTQAEWQAAWISCPLPGPSVPNYNQLRAEFALGLAPGVSVVHARMYITGMGYYSAVVNGQWARQWEGQGPDRPRLDPGWTTYEMRSLYNAYDITEQLRPTGTNAIAVMLGNGWPDVDPVPGNSSRATSKMDPLHKLLAINGGLDPWARTGSQRRLRAQIHVRTSDGKTLVWTSTAPSFESSDGPKAAPGAVPAGTWMCGTGALQDDSVYDGCVWDQRKYTTGWDLPAYAYDKGNWTAAVLASDPGGAVKTTMTAQTMPSVRLMEELPALSVESPAQGVYVFDFGQNIAGLVRLTVPAPVPAGVTITMRHAELLQHTIYGPKDGSIYVGNLRSAKATDIYTTVGTAQGAEVFEPVFTYHGFRYVEVSGLPVGFTPDLTLVTALFIRSSVATTGSVVFPDSANPLNQLQRAVSQGMAANLMSLPSDCPQRDERKGWMGDISLSVEQAAFNFDLASFYTFWILNMRDNQQYGGDSHPAGSLSDTVPHTFGSYPSDPAWGTAYPAVVYEMWKRYGDTRIAADHYANLVQYATFMQSQVNATGVAKLYSHYGEWCPPPATPGGGQGPKPPSALISAQAYLTDLARIIELATALGKPADAAYWGAYRTSLITAYNTAFLQANGYYGNANGDGLQTAQAVSLAIGAVPQTSFQASVDILAKDLAVTHGGAWAVGIVGMKQLHSMLVAGGYGHLAVDNLMRTSYPSFGYWFNNDNEPGTTMWELPDGDSEGPGMNSRNHHMFSSVGAWLYKDMGGINQRLNGVDAGAVGFTHPVLHPRVTYHEAVPFTTATYDSLIGRYAVSWSNSSGMLCQTAVPEAGTATFTCPGGSMISDVQFASFGTPGGTCGGFTLGACNAANSTAITKAACLGKSSCSISIDDTTFGDPCYNTVKQYSGQVMCSSAGMTVGVTVPANGRATVRVPFNPAKPTAGITVTETGTGNSVPVFAQGAFLPGAPGVYFAALSTASNSIEIEVGSGQFTFVAVQ